MLHETGKPFLHVVSYQAPHYPVQPSPKFEDLYRNKTIPYDPDYIEVDPYNPTFSPYSPRTFENCPDYQRYGGNMQEYMRLYYGMVSQIDDGVGRIMKCIEELGIKDETLLIFTSDHGDMQGSHGFKNKDLPYEKSCGIPLIISAPVGLKNHVSDILVSCIDLFPTCLDFAGLPIYNHFQGVSILPLITGDTDSYTHPPVIAESFNHNFRLTENDKGCSWKMIRDGKYKLTVNWDAKEPCLLYDMDLDPYEMNNLIYSEEHKHIIDELLGKLIRSREWGYV